MHYSLNKITETMKINNQEENDILSKESNIDTSIFKDINKSIISFEKIVPKGKLISIRKHTRYIHYPEHTHDYVELNYVLNGNSNQYVEGKKVKFNKGDLLFMGPGAFHEIFPATKEDIILNFIIHKKFFNYIFEFIDEESSLSNFFIDVIFKSSSTKALIFNTAVDSQMEELLNKIINELRIENDFKESKIKFLLGLLIIELIQQKPKEIRKDSYEKGILLKVISYIEKNLSNANLNELSLELKLKNYNLSKMIKKESGMTFNTIVRNMRFQKFCELIKIKNISINDLALEVGFSNTGDFYKKFKEKYNMSPREFRNTK